ncbi:hypothetical protein COU77_04335 [Candidatus Peregrinibacteria bacterium CG10_big_fil_rev_8_21_14_0_10_49_16]|nr:MAG: hypothetical protein COW95_00150 [Candidatus Peregrinibacteria bacterium CG22_combo_CG10-13_8_21_14_all_49_11]PIR51680.1 MAG: hypothetical protein COU77_04335 [Candidatus Peregrinibacteria bacterium CG10_big_fil_rev_8_21_14_0_10_49_16]
MQPVIPDVGTVIGLDPVTMLIALVGSLVLAFLIALVYRGTHRGLSYSQSFQFSLVLLGILGSVVMMVASGSLLRAIGILGAFSLIRFRTAVKDPKDMAYILFVLAVGLAMGAQMYWLAVLTTVLVCAVILLLTWMNFGMTSTHESILRLMCNGGAGTLNTAAYEAQLAKLSDTYRLLSAHAHGDRMEFTYGVRPRRGTTSLPILEALRKEQGVEDAELFDAKHQVEF